MSKEKKLQLGKSLLSGEKLEWYEVPPIAWAHGILLCLIGDGAYFHPYYQGPRTEGGQTKDKVGVMVCPKYYDEEGKLTQSIVPRMHGNVAYPRLIKMVM